MPVLNESVEFPGYYHVPGYDTLAVSREGSVVDLVRRKFLKPTIAKAFSAYPRVSSAEGNPVIHRLLALTFIDCPSDSRRMQVNHKDGVKTNYSLDNLEWVTPAGNVQHAYRAGLRPDNTPIEAMDLRNHSIERFYSLNECARHFGVNQEKVHRYLHQDKVYAFAQHFVLRRVGEDWPDLSRIQTTGHRNGDPRAILARGSNGKVYIFESAGQAGKVLGMNVSTIYYDLNSGKGRKAKSWRFEYLDSFGDAPGDAERVNGPVHVAPSRWYRKPVPVKVTRLMDDEVTEWPSIEAFAVSVGVRKNTLQKALLVKGGVWKGFRVEYTHPK